MIPTFPASSKPCPAAAIASSHRSAMGRVELRRSRGMGPRRTRMWKARRANRPHWRRVRVWPPARITGSSGPPALWALLLLSQSSPGSGRSASPRSPTQPPSASCRSPLIPGSSPKDRFPPTATKSPTPGRASREIKALTSTSSSWGLKNLSRLPAISGSTSFRSGRRTAATSRFCTPNGANTRAFLSCPRSADHPENYTSSTMTGFASTP